MNKRSFIAKFQEIAAPVAIDTKTSTRENSEIGVSFGLLDNLERDWQKSKVFSEVDVLTATKEESIARTPIFRDAIDTVTKSREEEDQDGALSSLFIFPR